MVFTIAVIIWLIAGYGSLAVVGWHNGIDMFTAAPEVNRLLYQWAPWVLALSTPFFWVRFHRYRNMRALRELHKIKLTEANVISVPRSFRPMLWERVSGGFMALAVAAIVYLLEVPNPGIVFIAAATVWLFVRLCLFSLKKTK